MLYRCLAPRQTPQVVLLDDLEFLDIHANVQSLMTTRTYWTLKIASRSSAVAGLR